MPVRELVGLPVVERKGLVEQAAVEVVDFAPGRSWCTSATAGPSWTASSMAGAG